MAATYEAIANVALVRMGNKVRLGTDALTSPTSEPALSMAQLQVPIRDSLLRMFDWNFSKRRRIFDNDAIDDQTAVKGMGITLLEADGITAATKGNLITVTAASGNPFAAASSPVGKNIFEVTSGTGIGIITSRTSDTVVIMDIIDSFSSGTIAASNWKLRYGPAAFGYSYRYEMAAAGLEADYEFACLRVLTVAGKNTDFEFENNLLLTNEELAEVEYIAKVTDCTLFDALFEDYYATMWAFQACHALTADKGAYDRLKIEVERIEKLSQSIHSKESSKRVSPEWWYKAS